VNLNQRRLLFVDDEASIRITLSAILLRYGFAVTVAATVAQALDYIQTQTFDVLLCDLNIDRECDGYELIRAMQKVNPQCVTIILTGYPSQQSSEEGTRVGIDDYIVKPANADLLVALLAESLVSRHRLAPIQQ
jgi:DNA-binding NtrC family response regulator